MVRSEVRASRISRAHAFSAPAGLTAGLGLLLALVACLAPGSASAAPRSFFGVSAVAPTSADMAGMSNLGLGTARVEISWRAIQSESGGGFNWHSADSRFLGAAQEGLRPLPLVFGTPEFIEKDPAKIKPPVRSKRDRKQWQRFIGAFAHRYGPGGKFWQQRPLLDGSLAPGEILVWNEQNSRSFWRGAADPGEYARLLRITDKAVGAVDPKIKLVAGGMYGYPNHEKSLKMTTFVKRLYRKKGVKKTLDGISLHPYASGIGGLKKQVGAARRILDKAGDRKAGIWIGEIGWASGGPNKNFLVKSPRSQAKLLKKGTRLLLKKRKRWHIKASLWYVWRDFSRPTACPWCPKAGLLKENSRRKPSYRAYRKLINRNT